VLESIVVNESVAFQVTTSISRTSMESQHMNGSHVYSLSDTFAWQDVRAKLAPYAAVPLRLIVGYGFLAHGLSKWQKGPEAFAGAGIAFLIGAFVSLVSIPAIILLLVAIFTVHLPYGFSSIKLLSVSNGRAQFGPPGYECNLLYIACILALAMSDPTPWSVDQHRARQALA
jgi:putative oxidoreductase